MFHAGMSGGLPRRGDRIRLPEMERDLLFFRSNRSPHRMGQGSAGPPGISTMTLLIVEDHEPTRGLLRLIFRWLGWET
jgi:hypothetical protein